MCPLACELRPQPIGIVDLVSVSTPYQGFDARHRLIKLLAPDRCLPIQLAGIGTARRGGQLDFLDALIQPEPEQRKAVAKWGGRPACRKGRLARVARTEGETPS